MSQPTTSVWVLGDQLLRTPPALTAARALAPQPLITVVLIESARRFARHPYHRKKVTLLKSAMRHYAHALRAAGYTVDYRMAATMEEGLRAHGAAFRPARLLTMAAAEYRGRAWQHKLADKVGIPVEVVPNPQFLSSLYNPFPAAAPTQAVVMESFYRKMRRHFGVLMDGDRPLGGAWNFDKDNRKTLPPGLAAPRRIGFAPDEITRQVIAEVDGYAGFGSNDGFDLAVTHEQADAALHDFIERRLEHFGAYEDAMTARDGQIFHSLLSPYLNIGLLEPLPVIRAAEAAYQRGHAPLNSVEGFIRQVLGWREFMYWQYWRQMPGMAQANSWGARHPLPDFFWSGETPLNCLRRTLARIKQDGYTHHIERLMLLTNFAMLTGLEPAAVNEWFLSAFIDAYEWVMLPNVLGMGLHADGGLTATKPYIASAHYIHKMSDYCAGCVFNPKKRSGADACPFNFLYWHFLLQHETTLRANPRFGPAVLGLRHLDEAERAAVRAQAAAFRQSLAPPPE